MNEEKCCLRCKGFILKIMLNGYHGICTKHDGLCNFVRLEDCPLELVADMRGEE